MRFAASAVSSVGDKVNIQDFTVICLFRPARPEQFLDLIHTLMTRFGACGGSGSNSGYSSSRFERTQSNCLATTNFAYRGIFNRA